MPLQAPEYVLGRIALLHPALQVGLGGVPQIELWVELAPQAFDVQQSFLQQHQ